MADTKDLKSFEKISYGFESRLGQFRYIVNSELRKLIDSFNRHEALLAEEFLYFLKLRGYNIKYSTIDYVFCTFEIEFYSEEEAFNAFEDIKIYVEYVLRPLYCSKEPLEFEAQYQNISVSKGTKADLMIIDEVEE